MCNSLFEKCFLLHLQTNDIHALIMDYLDIQPLINVFHRKLAATDVRFKRYLYGQINWNVRMVGIKRGTWGGEDHFADAAH